VIIVKIVQGRHREDAEMDEKDEKEVMVVTVIMHYDSSAYLRLTATDIDKYAYYSRTRQ
jgi:hypothetical protein